MVCTDKARCCERDGPEARVQHFRQPNRILYVLRERIGRPRKHRLQNRGRPKTVHRGIQRHSANSQQQHTPVRPGAPSLTWPWRVMLLQLVQLQFLRSSCFQSRDSFAFVAGVAVA